MSSDVLNSKTKHSQKCVFILFLLLFCNNVNNGNSAKILAILPYVSKSLDNFILPYIKKLSERGHELTVINGYHSSENITNTRFISIPDIFKILEEYDDDDFITPYTRWGAASTLSDLFFKVSTRVLNDTKVQNLLKSNEKFDLLIVEAGYMDALFGFAQHFNIPFLGISTHGSSWNIDYLVGNTAPSIYEPMSPMGYADGLNLYERFNNWIFIIEEMLFQDLIFLPNQKKLYGKYFPNAKLPFYDLRHNCSLIMTNQHYSWGEPRPNVPNLIEIGGMHIPETTKPLPDDLTAFVNNATDGVIYFSMGHDLISKHLPKGTIDVLVQTFNSLKQRVIWKYELDSIPNKTDNIYLGNWLPQMDILAHPNVKLFITHVGRLSISETVYFAKPALGFPLFYDQFKNIEVLIKSGMALQLDLNLITVASLMASIEKIINDPSYMRNAQTLSKRFRDQPISPLNNAIWWTEYVLRHNGAQHLRINEKNLSFVHYYRLDTVLVILSRIGLTLFIVIFLGYKIISLIHIIPTHKGLRVPTLN